MIPEIISKLEDIVYNIYIQNYYKSNRYFQDIFQKILEIEEIKEEVKKEESQVANIIISIMDAMEKSDMILLSDLIKEGLIPLLQSLIVIEENQIQEEFSIEVTSSGYYTLKDHMVGIYLHSNSNPMEEARVLISNVYDPSKSKYIVWGLGLGYHIKRMSEESLGAIKIEVYEDKKEILDLAKKYGVIKGNENNITCYFDPDGKGFINKLKEKDTGILIHYPSMKTIRKDSLKKSMENLYLGWNGTIQFKRDLEINFRSNQNIVTKNVDEILPSLKGKEVYLVAAGPSLDQKIELLKNKKEDTVIVVVTTILKKLVELDIVPDYTVIMDSQDLTLRQIEGLKNHKVPMIIGSTTYWKIAKEYKGEKYISYQKDFPLAENEAKEKNKNIYLTGGSVTTLALDILLRAQVKRINLVGADMAYLNGMSHAENTNDRKKRNLHNLEKIISVTGEIAYTEKKLLSYLRWIEREIIKYPEIKVYNYSETGALIKGTYNPYNEKKY